MGTGERMKEIEKTYRDAYAAQCMRPCETPGEPTLAGLRAVLETHVKPMLAEAYASGRAIKTTDAPSMDYAARIIASLTQEPARDV